MLPETDCTKHDSSDTAKDRAFILDENSHSGRFLTELISRKLAQTSSRDHICIVVKFILSEHDGFCIRSDFLERRLECCEHIPTVKGFLKPRQHVRAYHRNGIDSSTQFPLCIKDLLSVAVGAVEVSNIMLLDSVDQELNNRIDFPWVTETPITPKRLAWVAARPNFEESRRIWYAAWALGVVLVIIDQPGHWMQKESSAWSHLRESFIPLDIRADKGLAERLESAVRNYDKPIDGITTINDGLLAAVACACEKLGLPTEPAEAFLVASDKYRTREIEGGQGNVLHVSGVEDLQSRLSSLELKYPLIAKPCIGWKSMRVSKVHTQEDLLKAVQEASDWHSKSPQQRTDVMIEPYIDGPEIDMNLVLLNGEVVYFETYDDFPKLGDGNGSSFQETLMLIPSALPPCEIEMVRQTLQQSALRMGFRNGILHCEGRVRHSSMAYGMSDNCCEDLFHIDRNKHHQSSSFYLHEINARPPAYPVSIAGHLTTGVDFYALQILEAVGDLYRYRSLAHPFKKGPQWWLASLCVGGG
ncbi:hypothetical protein PG988_015112 [Apiospora saccharicola]